MSYERDALAAEGLLLREALEAYVFHCEIDGQRKSYCEGDYWCSRCSDGDACAVLTIPSLITAEVARVRRLEAVVEAAPELLALVDDMGRFVGGMALQDYARFNEAPMKMRAALKAYREGERPGGEVCHEKITAREKKGGD